MANKKKPATPAQKAKQIQRTRKNKENARSDHALNHPNDKQAIQNWKQSPL